MNIERVQVERDPSLDVHAVLFTKARDEHYDRVIERPSLIYEGENLVGAVLAVEEPTAHLLGALRRLRYASHPRTAGMVVERAAVFGYMPRTVVRHNYCRMSALARDYPREVAILFAWAQHASEQLKLAHPAQHARQAEMVANVLPDWRMPGSVFTSGIVNDGNELAYHRDSGNFKGSWNAMYAFSMDTMGGHLVLPEYRIALSTQENRLSLFEAQHLVHGVSHIVKRSKHAFRYSLVYYALEQLTHCLPCAEEIRRAQNWQTESARRWPEKKKELAALREKRKANKP